MGHAIRTVLVVDNDRTILEMVRITLTGEGYSVITSDTPLGLTAILRNERPDLVLVDVDMPSLGGDQLVEIIRRRDLADRSLLLLHSSAPMSDLRSLCRECGADGYITKGDPGHLLARVRFWMAQHRLRIQDAPRVEPTPVVNPADEGSELRARLEALLRNATVN